MIRRYKYMKICRKGIWRYEAQKNERRLRGKRRRDSKLRIELGKVQGRKTQRETERGRGEGISKQWSRIDAVWENRLSPSERGWG